MCNSMKIDKRALGASLMLVSCGLATMLLLTLINNPVVSFLFCVVAMIVFLYFVLKD